MRYHTLVPAFASLGVLAACEDQLTSPTPGVRTSTALSAASRTEFEGLIHPCGGTVTKETVTPGDVLHLLASNRNEWVTGSPLVDGVETNVARININLKTGRGVAHLQGTITPEALEGTWEMRIQLKVTGGFPGAAHGVGHGTGDLHGMTLKFTADPPVPGENTCVPELGIVIPMRVVIIAPAVSD